MCAWRISRVDARESRALAISRRGVYRRKRKTTIVSSLLPIVIRALARESLISSLPWEQTAVAAAALLEIRHRRLTFERERERERERDERSRHILSSREAREQVGEGQVYGNGITLTKGSTASLYPNWTEYIGFRVSARLYVYRYIGVGCTALCKHPRAYM